MEAVTPAVPTEEVRTTRHQGRVSDWTLVLHAMDIDHLVEIRDDAIVILVAPRDVARATSSLDAFDVESRPVVEAPAPDLGPSRLGAAFAALICATFVIAGPGEAPVASRWFDVGTASASRIVAGEWWRAVTAITLHADLLHLMGNVLAGLLFVSAVGRWLGAGLGAALLLASATAGNIVTAHAYGARHDSVGGSTATFAALGVLAGLQMARRWRQVGRRRRLAWVPLGAGVGLVVLLGMSERADVVAHLASLLSGVAAGAVVGVSGLRAPRRYAQAALSAATLAAVLGAWIVAFGHSGR